MFGTKLNKLKKKGKLKKILKRFHDQINKDTFIGYGNDASAFKHNDSSILKICVKKIGYFNDNNRTAIDFKNDVDRLQPFLLPIEEIIYEDKYVFIYRQPLCETFKNVKMTHKMLYNIFNIEYYLLKNGFYTNTTSHNLGIFEGNIIVFDYHDMNTINVKSCSIHYNGWLNRLLKHLSRYVFRFYLPNKRKDYKLITEKYDKNIIDKYYDKLPKYFIKFLHYVSDNQHNINLYQLSSKIKECIISQRSKIENY